VVSEKVTTNRLPNSDSAVWLIAAAESERYAILKIISNNVNNSIISQQLMIKINELKAY